jgi:hypothetical protein
MAAVVTAGTSGARGTEQNPTPDRPTYPNGIPSPSPGLRRLRRYPGNMTPMAPTPTGLCQGSGPSWRMTANQRARDTTPLGLAQD